MPCFPDPVIDDILNMSDEAILAECRANGGDPDKIAAEMRAIWDGVRLFLPTEDVNGKPRPRWEIVMEEKFNAGAFGEMLSLMRWLLELKERGLAVEG